MPNWCNNNLRLEHTDPAMIQRFVAAFKKGEAMQEFLPCPDELRNEQAPYRGDNAEELVAKYGASDWYNWCVNNWGTKWDVGEDDCVEVVGPAVKASFDSAWAPPCQAYERLIELGFHVKAYYYEPGMCFVGVWEGDMENGWDDDYHDYSGETSETVREAIGEELDDFFCISEEMAQYEEENVEE